MSIRLTIQADDAETECLLAYLESEFKSDRANKIYVLERALKWLHASAPSAVSVYAQEPRLVLDGSAIAPAFVPSFEKQSVQPQHQTMSQEVHK